MNGLSKSFLQRLKGKESNIDFNILIDKICSFDGTIDQLSIDYLKNESSSDHEDLQPDARLSKETRDYRVKNLSFCYFRTFPHNDPPYGVSFTNKSDEPCSLFLVGRNGTGKSTVFDALEWMYAGKVNNADGRGVTERNEVNKFLTYGFGDIENVTPEQVKLKAEFQDSQLKPSKWISVSTKAPLCVPAICCSDRDIERIAQLDDLSSVDVETNFQAFIREQLGYESLSMLKARLQYLDGEISKNVEKMKLRKSLSNLSSADIKRVTKLFEWMVFNLREEQTKEKTDSILKYANIKDVENILELDDIEEQLNKLPDEYRSLWTELKNNVIVQKQIKEQHAGEVFNITISETEMPNIYEKIKAQCSWIVAITSRLKTAWDTYKEDAEKEGLAKAMKGLSDDYIFLIDENNILPRSDKELMVMIDAEERLGKALTQLNTRLEKALAHIFETEDIQEGGVSVFQSEYPDKLNKFVEEVLNHYREPNEKFEVRRKSNSFEITITVEAKDGGKFVTTPKRYLNAFRFRLYAVLLKISLALFFMKRNNCVAPIVIDDVFNASDFENSISLSTFVCKIFEIYQEVIGYEYPLQLIMLTHDEMVTSAFENGAKLRTPTLQERINKGESQANEYHCMTGRLFHYSEAHEIPPMWGKDSGFLNLYLVTNI